MFEKIIKTFGVECVAEHRFHDKRKWRFDYAIISHKIAIEVEGAVWINGRHTRGSGFLKDMEKYNEAVACGWVILRCEPKMLLSSEFLNIIKRTINERSN